MDIISKDIFREKKFAAFAGLVVISFSIISFFFPNESHAAQNMARLYNENTGEHFYTSNDGERTNLITQGWKYEGLGWTAPDSGDAVYRLYNSVAGDHHYTLSLSEKNWLVSLGWSDEGISWYSSQSKEVPLYRVYNPNTQTATHHYTMNTSERDSLVKIGWHNEGIGWFGISSSDNLVKEKEDALKQLETMNLKEQTISFQQRIKNANSVVGINNILAAAQRVSDANDAIDTSK